MNGRLLLILTLLFFNVGTVSVRGQSYNDMYSTIKSQENKYPEDVKFSDNYLQLTEGTIGLVDSVLTDFMKSIKQDPFEYLSHDRRVHKIYERLMRMHDLGVVKTRGSKRLELINTTFQRVTASEDFYDWVSDEFKDKSQIESLAEMRQIQTSCYETINIVFDEIIENQK